MTNPLITARNRHFECFLRTSRKIRHQATLVQGLEHVRGGAQVADNWNAPYIQSMEFDNLNGYSHNASGNLLGVNFGSSTGSIHWYGTDGNHNGGNQIGDTTGLTTSRLGGLSVSPGNSKVVVTGYDSGKLYVYDHTPGDGASVSSALAGGRETTANPLSTYHTSGTTWLDDNTVVAFSANGDIIGVDANTMVDTLLTTVSVPGAGQMTDIEYNPDISPYVYAMWGYYSGGTTNTLFVLDPSSWALYGSYDFSTSMETTREIAFDSEGNLFVSQYSSAVDVIYGAADPSTITNNSSVDYYTSSTWSSYNGMDVAKTVPEPSTIALLVIGGLTTVLRRRR